LKGSAGSIGAFALAEEAAMLEQIIKGQPLRADVTPHLNTLVAKLAELIAAIRTKIPINQTDVTKPEPKACAKAALEFEQLLAENNPEAMTWFDQHIGLLRVLASATRMTEIESSMKLCDLEETLRLLRDTLPQKEMQ